MTFPSVVATGRCLLPRSVGVFQPVANPDPDKHRGHSHKPLPQTLFQHGLALKSSLSCPGEEAPPRPKSLVGVGTWGLQVIARGSQRRPWAAVPSAAQPDQRVGKPWPRPKTLVAVTQKWHYGEGHPSTAPALLGDLTPAVWDDRLPRLVAAP